MFLSIIILYYIKPQSSCTHQANRQLFTGIISPKHTQTQNYSILLFAAAGGWGWKPPVGKPIVLILWTRWATFPALFSLLGGWEVSSFGSFFVSLTSLDSFFNSLKKKKKKNTRHIIIRYIECCLCSYFLEYVYQFQTIIFFPYLYKTFRRNIFTSKWQLRKEVGFFRARFISQTLLLFCRQPFCRLLWARFYYCFLRDALTYTTSTKKISEFKNNMKSNTAAN